MGTLLVRQTRIDWPVAGQANLSEPQTRWLLFDSEDMCRPIRCLSDSEMGDFIDSIAEQQKEVWKQRDTARGEATEIARRVRDGRKK